MNAGESFEAEEILGARVKYFVFTKEGYVGWQEQLHKCPRETPPQAYAQGVRMGKFPP